MNVKVSIITPTFNAEKNIESCITSVVKQHYPNKEHLIIDGLSTDKTMNIVKRYAKKYSHIKWISEKDSGIYEAMNKGIDLATGDWIHFLGSDDRFSDNDVLKKIFLQNNDHEKFDFIYGNVIWNDTNKIYDGKFSSMKIMKKNICHQAIFTNRELYGKYGNFDVKYVSLADWDYNMKMFELDDVRKKYINITVVRYGVGGFSLLNKDLIFEKDFEDLIKNRFPYEYDVLKKTELTQKNAKEIANLMEKIEFLESSKFLRLRSKYMKLKSYVGK